MEARGYRGIAFTSTGRAALLLDGAEWLVISAAQGENLWSWSASTDSLVVLIMPPDGRRCGG